MGDGIIGDLALGLPVAHSAWLGQLLASILNGEVCMADSLSERHTIATLL